MTPDIFPVLEKTAPGTNQEVQLTDGLALLLGHQPIYAYRFEGDRFDTGRPLGLLQASVELALRREDMGPDLRRFLRGLDLGTE